MPEISNATLPTWATPAVTDPQAMPDLKLPLGCSLIFQPAPEIMAQVYALRVQAWRARTQAFPEMDEWRDEHDDHGLHWVVIARNRDAQQVAIAAARMTIHARLAEVPSAEIYDGLLPADLPGPIASINRLVVSKDYAGQGLSRVLDQARIAFARLKGCNCVIGGTSAGIRRHDDLLAQGFVALGKAQPYRDGPLATVKQSRGGICSILRL